MLLAPFSHTILSCSSGDDARYARVCFFPFLCSFLLAGERAWQSVEKVNAELFVLTYGAVVAQLVKDAAGDMEEVNTQLETMGYNIGTRLVDEFMARSGAGRCHSFEETAEVVARTAFKMFLGVPAAVAPQSWSPDKASFALTLEENPLAHFVELPEECRKLKYSGLLCGVIRGALEMVQMRVECELVKDAVAGEDTTEIRVTLKEMLQEEVPPGDD